MRLHIAARVLVLAAIAGPGARWGRAQGPTIEPPPLTVSPSSLSRGLGPSPGDMSPSGISPGQDTGYLGGRPGASTTRAPLSISVPGAGRAAPSTTNIGIPDALPTTPLPSYGTLDFPEIGSDPGPANGLTLDAAIELLVRENLFLRSVAFEIPQAEADILTASLRANPILYGDGQLVPYGNYSRQRPGGQTQYDLNISYPLDVTFKRKARMQAAGKAKLVLEQQYRDAVRLQIANLNTEFVNVLASRETLRYAATSLEGLDRILVPVKSRFDQGASNEADYLRVLIQRETADIGRRDAEEQLRRNKLSLANLLNIPPVQANSIEIQGTLQDLAPEAPPEETLFQVAMTGRPDLLAFRLGVERAEADVNLAVANRYSDVYVLYQPYTVQHNTGPGQSDSHSWALGVTVPLPIYNRNQGNIQKARLNVGQTRTELAAQIRQVATEVQQADREYRLTRESLGRFQSTLAPYARKVLESAAKRYEAGEESLILYLAARNEYVTIVKQYLDTLIRHRRAMLELNTAVGQRILP